MNIVVAGDFVPSFRLESLVREEKYDTILGDIKNIISSSDFSILNFESPIVKEDFKPIIKNGPNLSCTVNALEAIKWTGFNCITLANNHVYDYGANGLKETIRCCKEKGIEFVGVGDNLKEASRILYKEIDGETLAIINCCEHEFSIATDTTSGANPLNVIQQFYAIKEARQHADFVLVIVHGGHEHYQLPSPRMQETYRFFIDAGADAIINHHQHCYSGYELYKEKPIFYGLGNLLFDHVKKRNNIWNEGFIVSLHLKKRNNVEFELFPYTQCNDIPSIRLMRNNDFLSFTKKIEELNSIIIDESLLKKEHEKWMSLKQQNIRFMFEPYYSRVMKRLYCWGFLPSFVTKKRKLKLINYLSCESHIDIVRYIINKQ